MNLHPINEDIQGSKQYFTKLRQGVQLFLQVSAMMKNNV